MAHRERAFGRTFSAVLFDLDGVLIDTTEAITTLWDGHARAHGMTLSPRDITDCILGCSPEHTVASLFGHLDAPSRDRLLSEIRDAEPRLGFRIVPGARELVRRLHATHVPTALVTGASATRVRRVIATSDLAGAFETCVVWGDVERGKPAPDAYLLAARRLGLSPHDCLVLEDAPNGIRAAVAAGATGLGVGGDGPREALSAAGARHVLPSFDGLEFRRRAELLEVILPDGLVLGFRPAP